MGTKKESGDYTEAEAKARFEKTLRTALNTPPKPLKNLPRKRGAEAPRRGSNEKTDKPNDGP